MQSTENKIPSPRLWLIVLCLLFVALRWNNLTAPLTRDEGEYAYAAQILAHGQLPYEHSFLQKPPMIAYTYWLARVLLPGVFWSARLLACLFTAGTTVLLGYLARKEFGPRLALPVMWLVTPLFVLPGIDQFIANTEIFLLFPLLATLAVYVHARSRDTVTLHWFAAGFLGAITLGYKPNVLPLLGFVWIIWSIEYWQKTRSPRLVLQHWAFGIAGGSIAAALTLGPFLVHDHGARLWECTVLFNRYYAIQNLWTGLSARVGDFWHAWWILFLAPLAILIRPRPRVWFWTGLFFVSWITTGGTIYGHYYLVVMPFWALLAAVGLDTLAACIEPRLSQPTPWLKTALPVAALLLILVPDLPWMVTPPSRFAFGKLFGDGQYPFLESKTVAAQVAQFTKPDDFVFVAGSEPQILCYADRLSPTRFDIMFPLMIPTPLARSFQQEAIADLQQHPPRVIVMVRAASSWMQNAGSPPEFITYFKTLLDNDYEMVGGYVHEGAQGHWQEPLSQAESTSCLLVVYQRKTTVPATNGVP